MSPAAAALPVVGLTLPGVITTPAAAQAPPASEWTTPLTVADTQPALVGSLARLARDVDGAHELTVALHPADLGTVQVRAVLHRGALEVTIACTDDTARHAVVAALPDLHHRLSGLGRDSNAAIDIRFADADNSGDGRFGPPDRDGADTGRRNGLARRSPSSPELVTDLSVRSARPHLHRPNLPADGLDRWM